MIARLRGMVVELGGDRIVVECGGVGYEVLVPEPVALGLQRGEEATLLTRQVFREDGQFLYGFREESERRLFDLLRDVKNCGPKISLAVLSTLGPEGTVAAIQTQDVRGLARTPGVGQKMAERIALELREKVGEVRVVQLATRPGGAVAAVAGDALVEALVGLGYRRGEAEQAAGAARTESDDEATQLRLALKMLQGGVGGT